ncbi:hypothetical protein CgunFtcFv8_025424 [Champsocephalus gunnari]|uniref:Uncharacterized protein n=1 Tax=Champsocephalus gunnari TaxID=52237 RepID=A0AAN8CAD4_CHAGU|nr:hypothetical protein CgunFtcFv8_025424 [Champsocephalus gunnari]
MKKSINDAGHDVELVAVVQGDFLYSCAPFQGQSRLQANRCPLHPPAAAGKASTRTACLPAAAARHRDVSAVVTSPCFMPLG